MVAREARDASSFLPVLRDVLDVSRERVDFGAQCMPWLRVGGLRFS